MEALIVISGMLFRRVWGGWLSPNSLLKRVLGYILPAAVTYYCTQNIIVSLVMGAFILFGWLMPYHGYGIGMGHGTAQRPVWKCFTVMLVQYFGLTLIAGGFLWYMIGNFYYMPIGVIVPIGYLIAWKLPDFKLGSFIDSKTAIGELILGGSLIGGLLLIKVIQ